MAEKQPTLSRGEALKILGLTGSPDFQEIAKAFKNAAKKKHPDIIPPGTKSKEQIYADWHKLQGAYHVLVNPKPSEKYKFNFADYRKEFQLLAEKAQSKEVFNALMDEFEKDKKQTPNEFTKLQEAHIQLIQTPSYRDNEENARRLEAAYDKHIKNLEEIEIPLRERVKSKALHSLIREGYGFKTQEERLQDKVKAMNERLSREKYYKQVSTKFTDTFFPTRRVKLPFTLKEKGIKIIKYLAITAGIIGAIAAGKYIWDHRTKTFIPKLLEYKVK